MDLQQIIAQAGGVEAIAGQLGISPDQASSGIGALLPAVLGGFKKTAQAQKSSRARKKSTVAKRSTKSSKKSKKSKKREPVLRPMP